MLSASMNGVFSFDQIPATGKSLLHQLLPQYIDAPKQQITSPENFTYQFSIIDSRILSEIFFPQLGITDLNIGGKVNGQTNDVILQGKIGRLRFNDYELTQIELNNQLNHGNEARIDIRAEGLFKQDTILLKTIGLTSNILKGTAKTSVIISDTAGLLQTQLDATSVFANQSIRSSFQPSSFTFKNKVFSISDDGVILYEDGSKKITVTNFGLHHLG